LLKCRNAMSDPKTIDEIMRLASALFIYAMMDTPNEAIAPMPISRPLKPASMFVKLHVIMKRIGNTSSNRRPLLSKGHRYRGYSSPTREKLTTFWIGDNVIK